MIQALQELRKSKIRTLLITITLAFITLMVTFLSALTQGLSLQSVSALQEIAQENSVIISDTSTTLSSSHLTDKQTQELEKIGLGDKLQSYPQELSGGQQSRVGIARSLINNPDILLVYEPTASLDSQRSQEITELILQYTHEYNIATMFVSHSEKQLEQLDKIYTMRDGILT